MSNYENYHHDHDPGLWNSPRFGDPYGMDYRGGRSAFNNSPRSQLPESSDTNYKMSKSEDSRSSSGEPNTVKSVSTEFAEMTSMQGVNYIYASKRLGLKLLWIVILLLGCGFMVFHLYYLSSVYFAYPKQTKITLGFDNLQFPAITVCNINPIRASKIGEAGMGIGKLMEQRDTAHQIKHLNETEEEGTGFGSGTGSGSGSGAGSGSGTGAGSGSPTGRRRRALGDINYNYTNTYSNFTDSLQDQWTDPWAKNSARTEDAKVEEEFDELFSRMSREERIEVGHQLNTFLVRSSFAGRTVKTQNYKTRQSMKYGNCYTLQYTDFTSRRSGPTDGLEMILFLETEEYLRGWTNGNGAHLVVHDIDTIPLILQDGVAIAGGTETFIGLKRINIERLGLPYGQCDDGIVFKKQFNITYTRQMCQDYCLVKFTVDSCGCYDERHEETNINFKITDKYGPCRKAAKIKCVMQTARAFEFKEKSCVCHSPCSEKKFEKGISSRQWPSIEYASVLKEAVCTKDTWKHCDRLRQYDEYRLAQNFIKLNIYYEDLNYENITEDADYAEAQFLSDIGGTLGLWIGLSVLSIFEVGQFVVQLIGVVCGCSRSHGRSRDRKSDAANDKNGPESRHAYSEPIPLSRPGYDDYRTYR